MNEILEHKSTKLTSTYEYKSNDGRRVEIEFVIEFVDGEFHKAYLPTERLWTRTDWDVIAACYEEIKRIEEGIERRQK